MDPLIAIVIPLYNRANFIGRALESCLSQTCADFEVVVVDDGSTDNSCDVVQGFVDPRIRFIKQKENRGVGAARNLGADSTKAEWLVFLDSDDELVSTAVDTILQKIENDGDDVDAFHFRCKLDNGTISPSANPKYGRMTYVEYLEHLNACSGGLRDSLHCERRSTFRTIRYPDTYGLEDLYHLEFNKLFTSYACEEVLRLYHQDADNQLVKRASFDKARDVRFARDRADVLADALRIHGLALQRHAPLLLDEYVSRLIVLRLLSGDRSKAFETFYYAFKHKVSKPSYVATLMIGAVHPSLLMLARSAYSQLRQAWRRNAKTI